MRSRSGSLFWPQAKSHARSPCAKVSHDDTHSFSHFLSNVFFLLFLFSCSTQPIKAPAPLPASDSIDPLWSAAYHVALNYPIRDLSEQDKFIESDWIYEGKRSRYRFFITLSQTPPTEVTIEIQSQYRTLPKLSWQWSAPSLDKEAKLRQAIDVELQKSL